MYFRIGSIGDIYRADIEILLEVIVQVLEQMQVTLS